jgi:hypothetical protein
VKAVSGKLHVIPLLSEFCLLIVTITAVDLQLVAEYQQQQLTAADIQLLSRALSEQ